MHRAGHAANGLVGVADGILGIMAPGDRRRLILPTGVEVVGRDNSRQDVRAEKSIRAG
jgi:hypothetical protein